MKNVLFLVLPFLLLFLSISSYAQTLIPKQDSKSKKWGYVDENGKTIVKYTYYDAKGFSEDLAAVFFYDKTRKSNIWGFIDKTGKVLFSAPYNEVGNFTDGLAKVKKDRYLGFIDKTGKEIVPVKYDKIGNFSEEGLAKVKQGKYWGFISKSGQEIIPVKYDEIGVFSKEGIAKVNKGKYWGLINKTGKEIVPVKYDEIGNFSEEGLAKVASNGKSGFINKNATLVIPVKYESATDFANGYAAVMEYKQGISVWGIIDKTGKEILPATYKKEAALNMLSDITLLQKEIQGKQAEASRSETLLEEVEAVLDNDFYSDDCPPVEVLKKLLDELDKIEKELPYDILNKKIMETKEYLLKLKIALSKAISTQIMTEKYGASIAKKIMAGEYEIGMSKEMVEAVLRRAGSNQQIDMMPFYKKSVSTSSEIWEFDLRLAIGYGLTLQDLALAGVDYPTLVFTNGKLTSIIR